MSKELNSNETIITNFSRLTNASKYCRSVLRRMRECLSKHENAFVKIGITGTGQKPCYRIVYLDQFGVEHIYGSWWDMGDPLAVEGAVNHNWSSATVSFADLETFLATTLGVKSRPRNR